MNPSFKQSTRHLSAFFALLALAFLSGCQSYQLGHPAELPFETIFVKPAANDSFAPQAQALISAEVRENIIRDGRVKLLAKESDADAVLFITLSDYERKSGTRVQGDTEVAQDFDVELEATVALYDQKAGQYLIESRKLRDRTVAYVGNPYTSSRVETEGLIQSEYQAMPRLARDLGKKIADEVLSAW